MSTTFEFLENYKAPGSAMAFFNKHSKPGDTVTGTILDVYQTQITDYISNKPLHWDNGDPKMQIIIKIQTTLHDDEDDDGKRSIYVKTWGNQWFALWEAARETGAKTLAPVLKIGAEFTATFVREDPPYKNGVNPTKVYEYKIVPATTANLDNIPAAPTAQTSAAPAVPATTAPQVAPQVAQAPQTPAAAQAAAQAPAAAEPTPADKAKQLIGLGVDDQSIATATGLETSVIAAIRAHM